MRHRPCQSWINGDQRFQRAACWCTADSTTASILPPSGPALVSCKRTIRPCYTIDTWGQWKGDMGPPRELFPPAQPVTAASSATSVRLHSGRSCKRAFRIRRWRGSVEIIAQSQCTGAITAGILRGSQIRCTSSIVESAENCLEAGSDGGIGLLRLGTSKLLLLCDCIAGRS
jgi:hypothetical protein